MWKYDFFTWYEYPLLSVTCYNSDVCFVFYYLVLIVMGGVCFCLDRVAQAIGRIYQFQWLYKLVKDDHIHYIPGQPYSVAS